MILVLALRPGGELPKSVFKCVEGWARFRKGDDSALIVLECTETVAVKKLAQIAQQRGVTLFCEPTAELGSGSQSCLEDLQKRERTPLWHMFEEIPDDSGSGSYTHWGINE